MDIIPKDILREIDFMLSSIEDCNDDECLLPILLEHGIDPHGGWIDMDTVPYGVIYDIYEKLFKTGILKPFGWIEHELMIRFGGYGGYIYYTTEEDKIDLAIKDWANSMSKVCVNIDNLKPTYACLKDDDGKIIDETFNVQW